MSLISRVALLPPKLNNLFSFSLAVISGMATPGSPIKSLSVREDQRGSRTLHFKTDKERYKCIANFYFTIKAFVKFPQLHNKFNGYLINVHRKDGVSM